MPKAVDIIGQRFGKLVAIRPTEERNRGSIKWLCQCDCGNETTVAANRLRNGQIQSCGCSLIKDLTGQRFGRLLPTSYTHIGSRVMWLCLCDCGNETLTRGDSLQSGHTQSCGCLQRTKAHSSTTL